MMKISAVILGHNDQANIDRCLKSVSWCQEIILIDDYSTDATVKIARRRGAKIYRRRLNQDFAAQRNFGLSRASEDWVLFLDSDEIISLQLKTEIKRVIRQTHAIGFRLKRQDVFLGRQLNFGETAHVRLLRLARKNVGVWRRPVHEYWDVKGQIGELNHALIHQRDVDLTQFINRINFYTDLDALALLCEAKPFRWLDLFFKPLAKFIYNYLLLLGFLDGYPGLFFAYLMSLHSLVVRIKLKPLQALT